MRPMSFRSILAPQAKSRFRSRIWMTATVTSMLAALAMLVLPAAPAYAGDCTNLGSIHICGNASNSTTSHYPIIGVDTWCNGSTYSLDQETIGCGTPKYYYAAPGGKIGGNYPIDIDAVRFDANCYAEYDDGLAFVPDDRRGKGSQWLRFDNDVSFSVQNKQCYAPTVFSVAPTSPTSIQLIWNALTATSTPYDYDVVWNIRRDGGLIFQGKVGPSSSNPARMVWTDNTVSPLSTHSYTVSLYYGPTPIGSGQPFEGPQTSPATTTTPAGTPPPVVSPMFFPQYSGAHYSATMFANAPAFWPTSGAQVGGIYAGYNYVYCRYWQGEYDGQYGYNHWWLWTDLDYWSSGTGQGWVPAYFLANWGNDQAYTDSGGAIEDCIRP